tara:strand:+ start:383 stop:640 length:258 start_codon:yes stop_codon:yes gene_type:complete
MSTLSKDLNTISSKLDKAVEQLKDIAHLTSRLDDDYDLIDWSLDHLEGWGANVIDIQMRLEDSLEYFNVFAFDGDSIKEVTEGKL